MNKLLVMCPSRGRPGQLAQMIKSFTATKQGDTDLVVYLDADDDKIDKYDVGENKRLVGQRMDVSKTYNFLVNKYKKYDYYCAVNDDMVFKTEGWDKLLINEIIREGCGWGIAFGEDTIHSGKDMRPTQHVVSGNIIKTLGFIYPPEIYHLYGDIFLQDLGKKLNLLFYCKNVIIEHRHWVNYKADMDYVYKFADKRQPEEKLIYEEYKRTKFDKDCERLMYAISCDNKMLRPDGLSKGVYQTV